MPADAAASATHDRIHQTLEAGPIGTWLWDLASDRVLLDDAAASLFGLACPAPEMPSEALFGAVAPADRPALKTAIIAAIKHDLPYAAEYRLRQAGGLDRWLTSRGRVERDASGRAIRLMGFVLDISASKRREALIEGQREILELVARAAPLLNILDRLAHVIEAQSEGLMASFMLADEHSQTLTCASGPSLPTPYRQAIARIPIGPNVGSCGTAAHRMEMVIVSEIASDPLWLDYKDLALSHGLRACWSAPICAASGALLGTFANYYRETRRRAPRRSGSFTPSAASPRSLLPAPAPTRRSR